MGSIVAGSLSCLSLSMCHVLAAVRLLQIEQLQMHDNNTIYNKALKILTKYFGVEEEDSGVVPTTDGQNFTFGQVWHSQLPNHVDVLIVRV